MGKKKGRGKKKEGTDGKVEAEEDKQSVPAAAQPPEPVAPKAVPSTSATLPQPDDVPVPAARESFPQLKVSSSEPSTGVTMQASTGAIPKGRGKGRGRGRGAVPQESSPTPGFFVGSQPLPEPKVGSQSFPQPKVVPGGPPPGFRSPVQAQPPVQRFPAQPPAQQFPAQPPAQRFPAQPPAQRFPAQPPAQPSAQRYPAQPPAQHFPAQPPAQRFPAQPPAQRFPAQPAAQPLPAPHSLPILTSPVVEAQTKRVKPTRKKGPRDAPSVAVDPPTSTVSPQTSTVSPQTSTVSPQTSTVSPQTSTVSPQTSTVSPLATMEPIGQALQVEALRPPPRKTYGSLGRPIRLRANHFDVKFDSKLVIFHYDVDIESEKDCPKALKRRLINEMLAKNENIFWKIGCVFDGEKNLYSSTELKLPSNRTSTFEITLQDGRKDRKFRVSVKQAAIVYLSDLLKFLNRQSNNPNQTAIQALDIAMRHSASLKYITIGRSVFPHTDRGYDLTGGAEMWRGYYQSVRPQWKTLHLNLDVSNRAFVKEGFALDMLCELFQLRYSDLPRFQMGFREKEMFLKAIKGMKVEVIHTPIKRSYKIMGLSDKPVSLQTFPLQSEDGKTTTNCTVQKYFLDHYKMHLKYPNLPCLQAQPLDKHRYLPMEVCQIPKGQLAKKLDEKQTSNMIKAAARPAPERKRDIEQMMQNVDFANDPTLKSFGLSVSDKMVEVNGRVLPPPGIQMKSTVRTKDGVWDLRNNHLYFAADIPSWGLIVCVEERRFSHQDSKNFAGSMVRTGRSMGIKIGDPTLIEYFNPFNPKNNPILPLFQAVRKNHPELKLLIIILPGKTPLYGELKRAGDTEIGIATQCVQQRNVVAAKPQTFSNIFLKINAKLGGINSILNQAVATPGTAIVLREPVIILGADVTHPPAGDSSKPSIAAVVGSIDKYAVKYKAKICVQEHRMEIINNLTNIMIELLKAFYKNTGVKPKRIIFYRDGVGEGQFYQVLKYELFAIRKACQKLEPKYEPSITFLVVQKRHHTRLFCEDSRDAIGRSQNVPPGTTVDTTIIHPIENDFYLCSHNGIQGTSRPTHYHVLWDDNDYSADILHMLTYELCHNYARCTRAVSIPAPAYYAHLAAFRARQHLEELQREYDKQKGNAQEWLKKMQRAVETHEALGDMYFT